MKIKILGLKEVEGLLRIEVETPYGIEDLGLSLEKKTVDPLTGEPRWLKEIKELLNKKYENALIPTGEEFVGKEIEI